MARVYNDAQLKLYAQMLPKGFLHYGYFEDVSITPESISFKNIEDAQLKYSQNILDLITNHSAPVLDVGCGMGGFVNLLLQNNRKVVALTPDVNQAQYVKNKYNTTVIESKFEDINLDQFTNYFGTVVTSESLQYLQLADSLKIIDKILTSEGKWIACDYFRVGEAQEKSGHDWLSFKKMLDENNFKISFEKDITANILPTISYVYMFAERIGIPVKNFLMEKIHVKAPGLEYALQDVLPQLDREIEEGINIINPEIFKQHKAYKLLVIERK